MIQALTFDLWDTLVVDDSDEADREALGLPTKAQARRLLVERELAAHGIPSSASGEALDRATAWCKRSWDEEAHTPTLRAQLSKVHELLDLSPGPGFEALVEAFATMEVIHPPKPAPGVHEALELLSSRYPLGIVSDAVITPGRELRRILQAHGMLHYFQVCVFSDEAGHSKPAPQVFERAAAGLGVPLQRLAHVGDRVDKDVVGAQRAGARGILYTGVLDRGGSAELRVDHLGDLAALVASL